MNGLTPPRLLTYALGAMRIHMVMSLLMLSLAVFAETDAMTSTNNYYHVLLGIPRETLPGLLIAASAGGVVVMIGLRHSTFGMAVLLAVTGTPYFVYVASATYFVYGVLETRTYVTAAIYWSALGFYYISILVYLGFGLWVEHLKLQGRRHGD